MRSIRLGSVRFSDYASKKFPCQSRPLNLEQFTAYSITSAVNFRPRTATREKKSHRGIQKITFISSIFIKSFLLDKDKISQGKYLPKKNWFSKISHFHIFSLYSLVLGFFSCRVEVFNSEFNCKLCFIYLFIYFLCLFRSSSHRQKKCHEVRPLHFSKPLANDSFESSFSTLNEFFLPFFFRGFKVSAIIVGKEKSILVAFTVNFQFVLRVRKIQTWQGRQWS